ncbi:hypothetical protein D3C72_2259250 [compost metagenome]
MRLFLAMAVGSFGAFALPSFTVLASADASLAIEVSGGAEWQSPGRLAKAGA